MPEITNEEQLIVENSVATNLLEVIGRGIDFPFRYSSSKKVKSVAQSSAQKRINDSIYSILSTRIGERPFNIEYGSRLFQLVHEPNDEILHRLLHFYTVEALKRWEKRIEIINVSILSGYETDNNSVGIVIEYRIRNSHFKGSYVYPFVREGMPTGDLYRGTEVSRMTSKGYLE